VAFVCCASFFGILRAAPQVSAGSGYHAVRKLPVGGEGWWDYLTIDPEARRIYISRSTHVMVVDEDSGKVVGDIPDTKGVHGIALAPDLGKGYTSNGDAASVTIPIAGCKGPSGIAMDTTTRRVFIGCSDSNVMAIVNADTGKVIASPKIAEDTDASRFDPETHLAFASRENGTLSIVYEDSPDKFSVVANVKTQDGARTMALDPKTHHVFVVTADMKPTPPPRRRSLIHGGRLYREHLLSWNSHRS
jgi:DNA-binding beta-propeller fold protein YncE